MVFVHVCVSINACGDLIEKTKDRRLRPPTPHQKQFGDATLFSILYSRVADEPLCGDPVEKTKDAGGYRRHSLFPSFQRDSSWRLETEDDVDTLFVRRASRSHREDSGSNTRKGRWRQRIFRSSRGRWRRIRQPHRRQRMMSTRFSFFTRSSRRHPVTTREKNIASAYSLSFVLFTKSPRRIVRGVTGGTCR